MSDIVPANFDLDDARRQHSTTPRAERKRCPWCFSSKIRPCTGIHAEFEYECQHDGCGLQFDRPVRGGRDA